MMTEEAQQTFTLAELAAFAVPELQRLARSDRATLAMHGFKESDRFALNRLSWLLPKLVQMEASPVGIKEPGGPALPTQEDMDLLRRVTRFLNPI